MRRARLAEASGVHNYTLAELTQLGILVRWELSAREVYVALDRTHPASEELRALLVKIGSVYGFERPRVDEENGLGGSPPQQSHLRRDLRQTFGGLVRTLPLLLIFVRGSASGEQIARCIPGVDRKFTLRILWMFKAFGVLKSQRAGRGIAYSFDEACPFVKELESVLAVLDQKMPQWRVIAERDIREPRSRRREFRHGHRRNKRWRW